MFQPVPRHSTLLACGSLESSRLWTVEYSFLNQLADETASLPLLHLLLIDQGRNEDRLLHSSRLALQLSNSLDHSLERVAEAPRLTRHYNINIHSASLHVYAYIRQRNGHYPDRALRILHSHPITQERASPRLRNPDKSLQLPRCDSDCSLGASSRTHLQIEVAQLDDRLRTEDGDDPLRETDVLPEKVWRERSSLWTRLAPVKRENMLRHSRIIIRFRLILDYEDQVKPGKNRDWKVDVLTHIPVRLIPAQSRIGRCQDRGPSIQSRNDSTLGHAHSLLFKRLVYRDPVIRPHLVELVDASDH